MDQAMGRWAFLIGAIIAVLAGLVWQAPAVPAWVIWVLALLGLVVGLLNITAKETSTFLLAAIALTLVGTAGQLPALGAVIGQILSNILAFVWPAALVVALKTIIAVGKRR